MSRPFTATVPFLFCLLAAAGLVPGCAPRVEGVSGQSFYASGLADFSLSVAPPLSLVSSGKMGVNVPSDVSLAPRASFVYAIFSEPGDGPVFRHVHTIFSELPRYSWQWEKETWALPQTIFYNKRETGGKFWTTQILPVTSASDWFSAVWTENGRETPEFWLAKRWSATPEEEMRLLAEYREPAPACMRQRLRESLLADDKNSFPLRGSTLRAGCEEEIEAFSARAEAALSLERLLGAPSDGRSVQARPGAVPSTRPDMAKLVGKAQKVDTSGDRYSSY